VYLLLVLLVNRGDKRDVTKLRTLDKKRQLSGHLQWPTPIEELDTEEEVCAFWGHSAEAFFTVL